MGAGSSTSAAAWFLSNPYVHVISILTAALVRIAWASSSTRSRSRADVAVEVVEYATKNLRLSGCTSVLASRESRGTTHGFGSVSTTLNGGLDAFRLRLRPIPPSGGCERVVGAGRVAAECEDACSGYSDHVLAFAGAA